MAHRLSRFSIGQTAKVLGVLYLLMGLIFLPFFFIAAALSPKQTGFGVGFALVLPVLYGIIGFVCTAIGCALYNFVARLVGGIEIQLDSSGPTVQSGLRPAART
ncbi:MAG: hypothetical protein DMD65_12990 [Gemmatimonadetes bacterium]|nr:MAG: hypothetical protein DMD65_12990 [Gemmatimonadota bacterium]